MDADGERAAERERGAGTRSVSGSPLTSTQKRIVLALTIVIALTRFAALSKSLWDWDEALFTLGVTDYDVAIHHPHPPGYPLFMAAAKVVHVLGVPEFRAVQTIVALASFALFPSLFVLAMELGFGFATSLGGAAIFCFLPNVWIYSGAGLSDVPAIVLTIVACTLLLRGRRDSRAFIEGAIVLALAATIRPTHLLIGVAPALVAMRELRKWKPVAIAALAGLVIIASIYGASILASESLDAYLLTLRHQAKWVHDVDGWANPHRPALGELSSLFLLTPVQHEELMWPLDRLAVLSLIEAIRRRRTAPLLTAAMFLPIAIVSLVQLDASCAGRYAIAYVAMHALLAADGLGIIARHNAKMQSALAAIIVIVFAAWTWPALQTQRTTKSPPVLALEWVLEKVPANVPVYIHNGLAPYADIYFAHRAHQRFERMAELAKAPDNAYVILPWAAPHALNFERPHGRLWKIVRRRLFEASVSEVWSIRAASP